MRPSRVFRLIFRIFLYVLTLSVTLVSFLGGMSALLILGTPGNLGINPDDAEFNLDFNNVTLEVDNAYFRFPFNFTNTGYFDLENLELQMDIALNYSHVNYTGIGVNVTRKVPIFSRTEHFGTILRGATGRYNFTGVTSDFGNFPNFTTEVDWYREPSVMLFYINLTISLDYSIGLHHLFIRLLDIPGGGIP